MIFFFFMLQVLAAVIIGWVLKRKLSRLLMETGLKELVTSDWVKVDDDQRFIPTERVMVVTQHFLGEADRNRIIKVIAKYFQTEQLPHFAVDPAIWGGIIFQCADKRIDCSLKTKILQMFNPE